MARLPRPYLPGRAQHIIQRGNNRVACFDAHEDYTCYLHHLKEAAEKYQVAIHAFVFMTKRVHLLATPQNEQSIERRSQPASRGDDKRLEGSTL
ncbi:MAG TPA: transposase [Marinagarivorans sp.]